MKALRTAGTLILLIITILACDILCAGAIALIQKPLLVPANYLVWTFNAPAKYLILAVILLIDIFLCVVWSLLFLKNRRRKSPNRKRSLWAFIGIFAGLLIYIQITSVSVFTDKEIINHSFYHPNAQVYTYADIRSVQVGMYGNYIPYIRHKGDFYYIVTFKDGTKINLMDIGEECSADTYSQVEKTDKIIMSYGVQKTSSERNIQSVKMDKTYVDRFKRIIDNK